MKVLDGSKVKGFKFADAPKDLSGCFFFNIGTRVSMTYAGFLQIEQHCAAKPLVKAGGGTHHTFQ